MIDQILRATLAFCLLMLSPSFLHAQTSKKGQQITINHTAMKPGELPYPGAELRISVTLGNTRNSQLILKGFFVKDGKVMEQDLDYFSTDNREQLVYSTTITSPLAELNYQFVLMDKGQVLSSSPRYTLRRQCLPDVSGVALDDTGTQDLNVVERLQLQASKIQDEVQNFEKALSILDELKVLTEK